MFFNFIRNFQRFVGSFSYKYISVQSEAIVDTVIIYLFLADLQIHYEKNYKCAKIRLWDLF